LVESSHSPVVGGTQKPPAKQAAQVSAPGSQGGQTPLLYSQVQPIGHWLVSVHSPPGGAMQTPLEMQGISAQVEPVAGSQTGHDADIWQTSPLGQSWSLAQVVASGTQTAPA
jgi:hypothetical protein